MDVETHQRRLIVEHIYTHVLLNGKNVTVGCRSADDQQGYVVLLKANPGEAMRHGQDVWQRIDGEVRYVDEYHG